MKSRLSAYRTTLMVFGALSALALASYWPVLFGRDEPAQAGETVAATPIDASPMPPAQRAALDPRATDAAKAELMGWAQVKEVLFDPALVVEWQVGVLPRDGSSWVGYAETVCIELSQRDLVDRHTDVRIVDLRHLVRSPGDFRGASLGHVACATGENLGI